MAKASRGPSARPIGALISPEINPTLDIGVISAQASGPAAMSDIEVPSPDQDDLEPAPSAPSSDDDVTSQSGSSPNGGGERFRRLFARFQPLALAIVLLGGLAELLYFVDDQYAIQDWLVWRYAAAWGLSLFVVLGSFSTGHLVLRKLKRTLPLHEHLLTALAVGVFVFCLGNFVFGLLHLYGPVFFWGWPALMIAAGGRELFRYSRRAVRLLAWQRRQSARGSWLRPLIFAFGVIGFLMVYFVILTPDNTAYDARWKHLAVAETYAVEHGIRRFPEGWTVVTYPHLVSILFTWCFLEPGQLFDKIELCAHLEFILFALTTLLGVPALVRRLVPRVPAEVVWPIRFLFPGILLYDSSLGMGADHVGALWAAASATLVYRAWRDLSPSWCALLAFCLAGGIQTKMTALILLLPFPIGAIVIRSAMFGYWAARGRISASLRKHAYQGPLAALVTGIVTTAPFWLKNWIWYGDPFYPVLYKYLKLRPWTPDSANIFENGYGGQFWRPTRDLDGVLQTVLGLFNFAFIPNDWQKFHGKLPVFGFLLTLGVFTVPFLTIANQKGERGKIPYRLLALLGSIHLSIACWFWTHHQDRYLQTILPLMVAATAGIFAAVWRFGWLPRMAVSALILGQVVWAGDVYFFPTHAMIRSPIKAVADLLATGFKKQWEKREKWFNWYGEVGRQIPPGSRLLLHEIREHVGVNASTVSDFVGWQGGISYGRLGSAREVHELLKGMGVTHLLFERGKSKSWDSLAGDLMFFDYAYRFSVNPQKRGRLVQSEMPAQPPPADDVPGMVVFLGCGRTYRNGLYTIPDMRVSTFGKRKYPPPRETISEEQDAEVAAVAKASFAVVDPACAKLPEGEKGFVKVATREGYEIVKKTGLTLWIRTDRTLLPQDGDAAKDAPKDSAAPADQGAHPEPGSPAEPAEPADPSAPGGEPGGSDPPGNGP